VLLPVVLAYQAWTYYVFRQRVSPGDFQPPRLLTGRGTAVQPDGGRPAGGGPPAPNPGNPAQ
jgi:hypothetical protein